RCAASTGCGLECPLAERTLLFDALAPRSRRRNGKHRGLNISAYLAPNQAHSQFLFDLPDVGLLIACAEGRGESQSAGASSPSYAVNEILRYLRKIIVDHVGDAVHMDAASRYVS